MNNINPDLSRRSYPCFKAEKANSVKVKAVAEKQFDEACHFPLLKGLGFLLLTGALTVTIILTAPASFPFIPIALAVVVIALPIFINRNAFAYEVSLIFTRFSSGEKDWMHSIPVTGSGKLYLGGIPLHDYHHVNAFTKKTIRKVVSLVEPFEQKSRTFGGRPVSSADWEEKGIEQTLISTPDFKPVSKENIEKAVIAIHKSLQNGQNVYVHCKAGRGRSATAVICYLLKYEKEKLELSDTAAIDKCAVDRAIQYVKTSRKSINLNNEQQKAVLDYFSS